jgi:hypothetical protein
MTALTQAIHGLVQATRRTVAPETSQRTKVREPDTFDGMEPRKLRTFLVQCELNFQDHPRAFRADRAEVTFAQSYLKGMALEWFEPDLLNLDDPEDHPLWMEDYREFVLELQINFGPHDPVGDAEHQLDHLSMKDGQRVNKYVVEFNRLSTQVRGYGEGALRHHFYNGLPDRIKDEVSRVGKPSTLLGLRSLVQDIDARYWERKSEISRQTKPTSVAPPPSKTTDSSHSADPRSPSSTITAKTSTPRTTAPDLTNKLGADGKLTSAERTRRFELKLCMFCGGPGHKADACDKATSRAAKGRAAIISLPEPKPEASFEANK